MKKKSAYCHKGLLIEIFRKEAESQNNRNQKCYNDAAMKKKPQIGYSKQLDQFTCDGDLIPELAAFEFWEEATADWSQAAYQEMSRRVMA